MAAWLDLVAAADKNGFYLFKIRAIDLYALVKDEGCHAHGEEGAWRWHLP